MLVAFMAIFAIAQQREKELALGKALAAEVERTHKLLDDAALVAIVNAIGQKLAGVAKAAVPFTFRVIDEQQPFANALPGGFVYVSAAQILREHDEAELAGVLAHEMAHVVARHGQSGPQPMIFMGTALGVCTRYPADNLPIPPSLARQAPKQEEDADILAAGYLLKAGYATAAQPNGIVNTSRFQELREALERRKAAILGQRPTLAQ